MEEKKEFTTGDQAVTLARIEALLEEMIFQQIRTRVSDLDDAKQLFSIALKAVEDGVQEKIKSLQWAKGNNAEGDNL